MQILQIDLTSPEAPKQFAESLMNTGFAVLHNHPIDPNLILDTVAEWKEFFAGSTKHDHLYDKTKQLGYFPFKCETAKGYAKPNLLEFYHYNKAHYLPSELSSNTDTLFTEGYKLAQMLTKWLYDESPDHIKAKISQPLQDMIKDSTTSIIRIIHYPGLEGNEAPDEVRNAAHEDINILTVLPAATAGGLQVQDKEGNWHDVQSDPGTIVINAGDMLQMATDGFYKSTCHRVLNPPVSELKKPRYSVPMFFQARDEVRLNDQYTAGEYLRERLRENGLLAQDEDFDMRKDAA